MSKLGWLDNRGDTLIEVTVAVAILGTTIISAYALMNRAMQLGETAKERVELVVAASKQAEQLTAYRDNNDWTTFTSGIGPAFPAKFHMDTNVPKTLEMNVANDPDYPKTFGQPPLQLGSSIYPADYSIWITYVIKNPNNYIFTINYSAPSANGLAPNASTIILQLTNLQKLKDAMQ